MIKFKIIVKKRPFMNKEDLTTYLELVFAKEEACLKETWTLSETDKLSLIYEHANTLIDIYNNLIEEELKEEFIKLLSINIEHNKEILMQIDKYYYITSSALSFYTLLKLGFVDMCLSALANRSRLNDIIKDRLSGKILKLLVDIFKEDYNYFNLKQLHRLLNIIKILEYNGDSLLNITHLTQIITDNAYNIIKKEIKGVNIEINRDKEAVVQKITYLNFDDKYNEFLNELDIYINTENALVSSGMIGNLRSFMENLLTDLAKKISNITNEEISKNKDCVQMGNIRTYLKIKLELSEKDNALINKYIDVLHAEGGHSFTSNIEYFRLSRNIGIEIVLLLLSKYENLYPVQS